MKHALLIAACIVLASCAPCSPHESGTAGSGGWASSSTGVGAGGIGGGTQCPLLPTDCMTDLPQETCPFDDWPLVQVRTCAGPGDEGWEVEQWCMKSSVQDVTCDRLSFGGIECCCIDGEC